MKSHPMFLVAFVAACASGGGGGLQRSPTRDVVEDTHGQFIRTVTDPGIESTVPMGIDAAYAAVGVAYMRIGIEVATHDQSEHMLGNTRAMFRGTLHGKRLSRYFNCGSDLTGELADLKRVTISAITTLVVVDATTTRLTTVASGSALSSGTSTDPVYCSSTGLLERELLAEATK